MDIRIHSSGRPKQNLHIYCSPCLYLGGPVDWDNCDLSLACLRDAEFRDTVYVLSDRQAGVKVECLMIDAVENVEPLYG